MLLEAGRLSSKSSAPPETSAPRENFIGTVLPAFAVLDIDAQAPVISRHSVVILRPRGRL